MMEPQGKQDMGSEIPERTSQPLRTSGRDSSQYTFAHIGIQAAMCDNLPKRGTDQTELRGWQSALMANMMWLSNVVGEYLTKLDQKPEVAPMHLPRLIDDPVSTLEQTVMDLQVAHEAKDASSIPKQLGLLMYYTMLMAMTTRLHPHLSSTFLWIHAWQLSKIYDDFGPAESVREMLKDVSMKEVKDGYIIVSTQTLKVLGDDALEGKADVVLMTPVEILLDMVPSRLGMPYMGLSNLRFPEKGCCVQ